MTKWVHKVKTTTVNTPEGVMTVQAKEMAMILLAANPERTLGSIIRYIQFYLNRGGVGISEKRRIEIEKCKRILQELNLKAKQQAKKSSK